MRILFAIAALACAAAAGAAVVSEHGQPPAAEARR